MDTRTRTYRPAEVFEKATVGWAGIGGLVAQNFVLMVLRGGEYAGEQDMML